MVVSKFYNYLFPQSYNLILQSDDDQRVFSSSTTVVIYVIDENDNAPVFDKDEYTIQERVVEEDYEITPENPMTLMTVCVAMV